MADRRGGAMNDRNDTIKRIKTALQRRSGKQWSVTGGRGTAWGWIRITAPPARCTAGHDLPAGLSDWPENYVRNENKYPQGGAGVMTITDKIALGELLGLDKPAHDQGESVGSSSEYYREYIDRAEGRTPAAIAQPYWD